MKKDQTTSPALPAEAGMPSPWNPEMIVSSDSLTGKFRLKINFGMGYPWIACSMANPFRVADSGLVFESEADAMAAGDFFIEALEVLMHDFSSKGN